ncbi:glycine-rich domain-containing protein [Ferruginibacter albus]|uniref:glycine-rich domain-containing protein n=1 Tax=Ferruginibacter albus TaxID=2875540 RepID=UPI001CC6810C|nr:hypothetical protein [Ferruginibacter albus]UAY51884.1 hypothetical protein K9M53_14990 [Ferruginibacter albus]
MNQELWNKILAFDFDDPPSEYGFSIRLANENFWTKEFTDQAIVEYKKFMYLAATSDFMVSPSEIIDQVWHQHLIFTQSYQDFCSILGKQIQHIPSTHNKEEFEKFRQAKERTIKFYERDFGKQPKNIWAYNDMFESLNLEKAKFKLRSFLIFGIFAFICLTVPAYFLLRPIYVQIDNPYFIWGLILLAVVSLLTLEFYNKAKFKKIISGFDETSFIYTLQPFELVYLKTQKLASVINGTVNELVENGAIKINAGNSIELAKSNATVNNSQLQVTSVLSELGATFYPALLRKLATKPIFGNIVNSMDAFRKYFNKSKKFALLFYTNLSVFTLLILLSFTRIVTGVLRDKPVTQIVMVTVVLVVIAIAFLYRLTMQISTTIIPDLYKNKILPSGQIEDNWQWKYFLSGTTVLATSFAPLVNYIDRKSNDRGNCATSCGSSCGGGGSSCSSCGGCGSH